MKKYNLSSIMKRAWELVKKVAMGMSAALTQAWKEAKGMAENMVDALKAALEDMAYGDYHINAGVDRKVNVNVWEKGGQRGHTSPLTASPQMAVAKAPINAVT